MSHNYYWILPYVKKHSTFFVSDIESDMKKDDIYFNKTIVRHAIEFWIDEGCIKVLDTKYFVRSGTQQVKKYIYIKDPE